MKQAKRDIALSEKDSLQDMLDAEKLLMSYYNAALTEGSCKPFRKEILRLLGENAETQFTVFEEMLSRGYYKTQPAEEQLVEEKKENFKKVLKQIKVE